MSKRPKKQTVDNCVGSDGEVEGRGRYIDLQPFKLETPLRCHFFAMRNLEVSTSSRFASRGTGQTAGGTTPINTNDPSLENT